MKTQIPMSLLFAIAMTLAWLLVAGNVLADAGSRSVGKTRYSLPSRAAHAPQIGRQVSSLPTNYHTIRVRRTNYHYHSGAFYRPGSNNTYVVIGAPIGARVPYLPGGYVSFLFGSHRYFYINYTYYFWDRKTEEYVVVEQPDGAEAAIVSASEAGDGPIFVYPSGGQSDEQRERDHYECHLWAAEQTGYDPSAATPQTDKASDHRRATSACLEGRDYTVK